MEDNSVTENDNISILNDNDVNFCKISNSSSLINEEVCKKLEDNEYKDNTVKDEDLDTNIECTQEQDISKDGSEIENCKHETEVNEQKLNTENNLNDNADQEAIFSNDDTLKQESSESNIDNSETLLNSDSGQIANEEQPESINVPESSLPYKLWIDAKSRDWILEWQTKNGRWSVRKFSCKRWGKGKAYSHAMNFLASLTSCGIIKDSNYNCQINDINGNSDNSSKSNRSVEDELVLQFLSQRDAAVNVDKQKSGFGSNSGLNTLAAIAAAATAAAIASTPNKNQSAKEQSTVQSNTHIQQSSRGAVRKSGVPGVYWSQKPQGWRVVYYTGKDREFEYFKVPANASEEIISEILEVAKRFRSQVTAEGRHLPNGAVGSGSKRARLAERKAAAAAAAAAAASSNSATEASRHVLQNRAPHYSNDNIGDYIKSNVSDSKPKNLLDNDPLSQFTAKFNTSNNPNIQAHNTPIIPNPFEWIYNPLLLNLYGNYSAATQAAAMQQWAMLQNSISQNNNLVPTSIPNQTENSANPNPVLNSLVPNPFMSPFPIQLSPIVTQNSNIISQIPPIPPVNSTPQMGMNMFNRYYNMTLPTQSNQINGTSVTQQSSVTNSNNNSVSNNSNNGSTNSIGITATSETLPWLNQLASMQQVYSNLDQPTQLTCNFDPFKNVISGQSQVGIVNNDEEQPLSTETNANKQSENLLEITSSSNKTSN